MKKIILFPLLFFVISLHAQEDVAGSEDHPLLTRYPGAKIASYENHKYMEYVLATGPVTGYRYIKEKDTIAGQVYRITYQVDKPVEELSIGEVYQDYLQAVQKAELDILTKGYFPNSSAQGKVGNGGWINLALGTNKFQKNSVGKKLFAGTSSAGGTFTIISNIRRPDGVTHVAIYGERHSSKEVIVQVDIIEEKSAETGLVSVDADYIKKEIEEKGMIVIYGITFDFDSANIKPESKPTLDEVGAFLKANPEIDLYIVGHTDMKGTLEYNKKLSMERATAVVDALVEDYEIDRKRLVSDGVGPLAPKSTNDTDDGRSLNRRVELVKRN